MAKKIFEFDIETDRELIKMYDAAEGSYLALWEFLHNGLRHVLKSDEVYSEDYIEGFTAAFNLLQEIVDEKGVVIE